jgi:hypothetical protein
MVLNPPVSAFPSPTPAGEAAEVEAELAARIRAAGLAPQSDYTTGEAARILGASRETVRQMILRWEPPDVPGRHPAGLFARRLGSHRRIPHQALADWLARNTAYRRDLG